MQKDNTTFDRKALLRENALRALGTTPVILESHGGRGKLWARCYSHVEQGIVFEQRDYKISELVKQRPTWAVYEADCVEAIEAGVGTHLPVNFVDLDPYGQCWPALEAFFAGHRPQVPRLVLAVNDGLRNKLRVGGGWEVRSVRDYAQQMSLKDMCKRYLDICKDLTKKKAASAGYRLTAWTGYYCGHNGDMTHFAAVLDRDQAEA